MKMIPPLPLTAARAHTPASATAAAKRQTPPRTPALFGQSAVWLSAALPSGFGFGGSSAGQTSLSRNVRHYAPGILTSTWNHPTQILFSSFLIE
jgi:hypothetical protein